MSSTRIAGFRLGIYIFKDAEIVDFAAPYGVFSVARRFDPELDSWSTLKPMSCTVMMLNGHRSSPKKQKEMET
jgi:hypothetical protein